MAAQAKAQSAEVSEKKTMRKKSVDAPKKTKAAAATKADGEKKPAKKLTKKVVEKKETKKKSKKEAVVEEKVEVEKVPKAPKKINIKPTIADIQGLNLSVAKVKNIISNLCINKEIMEVLKNLKASRKDVVYDSENKKKVVSFKLSVDDISEKSLSFLEACHASITETAIQEYGSDVTATYSKDKLKAYKFEKHQAMTEFYKSQKNTHLFGEEKFDIVKFNKEYDPEFYANMAEQGEEWKELVDDLLYIHCVNLVTKSKIRFNSESKIFITAFVEYIIQQLIVNGTVNCIADKKKIIQLEHALNTVSPDFTMFPFIANTSSYKAFVASASKEVSEEVVVEEEEPAADEEDDESTSRKLQFKYYVAELCRDVRMSLSASDEEADPLLSKYNQTSVSKRFNQFCSDVIIELLHIFGNALKVEVLTRDVKTVNYSIIKALVLNTHILYNIDYTKTIEFIQKSYNAYNDYLEKRSQKRESKSVEA